MIPFMRCINPDYIRGFVDRSFQVIVRDCCIVLTAKDREPIASIYVWLRDNGFHVSLRSKDNRHVLRCSGRDSLDLWKYRIGSYNKRLAENLDRALKADEVQK